MHYIWVLVGLLIWGRFCFLLNDEFESDDTNLSDTPYDFTAWENADFYPEAFYSGDPNEGRRLNETTISCRNY